MKYRVLIAAAAERDMEKLPNPMHGRISDKILRLEDSPRPRGCKKLSGHEEYRIRVGDYRVLFTIDDKDASVTVMAVGHRRDVYR